MSRKESLDRVGGRMGSGGNLWVFAEQGCKTIGLDISKGIGMQGELKAED